MYEHRRASCLCGGRQKVPFGKRCFQYGISVPLRRGYRETYLVPFGDLAAASDITEAELLGMVSCRNIRVYTRKGKLYVLPTAFIEVYPKKECYTASD